VKKLAASDGTWCYSRPGLRSDPTQGWKIHVSATRLSANEVFSRVRPILTERDVLFKVPAHLDFLGGLNSGIGQFSQVGKFVTVYPSSTAEAIELARALHSVTRGLRGPEIPFDVQYRKNSLVYYRYGVFRRPRNSSARSGVVFDTAGHRHPDRREAGHAIPRWLKDPFRESGADRKKARSLGPIGAEYLPYKAFAQRGKGGIYEAVDLSALPPRIVIIKEGRRDGETAWNGADGYARVQHEARVLRSLRKAGVPVPEILRTFSQNGAYYLVLEKIVGRQLFPRGAMQPRTISWRRAARFLERLEPMLSQIHAAGWVWRDCKPSHIFLHRGVVRLLDFEGACPIDETQVLTWGSANYLPRDYYDSFTRRPGIFEDRHAIGVIAFQFGTGKFPPEKSRQRKAIYCSTRCPGRLQKQIENLLNSKSG
jgi:serine/threonine protein kinase